MNTTIKCRRGKTICHEIVNGEWNRWSFTLPTKVDYRINNDERIIINFYAKEIELKIGDIIHSYWGAAYKVLGGNCVILDVEEIKEG